MCWFWRFLLQLLNWGRRWLDAKAWWVGIKRNNSLIPWLLRKDHFRQLSTYCPVLWKTPPTRMLFQLGEKGFDVMEICWLTPSPLQEPTTNLVQCCVTAWRAWERGCSTCCWKLCWCSRETDTLDDAEILHAKQRTYICLLVLISAGFLRIRLVENTAVVVACLFLLSPFNKAVFL